MKTVLFVPGFQEDVQTRDYRLAIKAIESKGYKVKPVPINWKRTTIVDWQAELEKEYSKCKPEETILAGFSFGAMTVFVAATKRNPSELWLFSLSPYFAEDHESKSMKQIWLKQLGKHRVEDFAKLKFKKLSRLIKCKTLLFAGDKEIKKYIVIGERLEDAGRKLARNKRIIVAGVGHDVSHPGYVKSIMENI